MNINFFTRLARKFLIINDFYQLDPYAQASFSQMGEDRLIKILMDNKEKGFYVDVGAYHPKIYSNTYLFYLAGWRGINIDPTPGSMKAFRKDRPRDINLEFGIGLKAGRKKLFISNGMALNTTQKRRVKKINEMKDYYIERTVDVKIMKLSQTLDKYLPKGEKVDFLNVDVEGSDLEVLKSNNWKKYRPKIIIAESLSFSFENMHDDPVYKFLVGKKYSLEGKTNVSLIFKSKL